MYTKLQLRLDPEQFATNMEILKNLRESVSQSDYSAQEVMHHIIGMNVVYTNVKFCKINGGWLFLRMGEYVKKTKTSEFLVISTTFIQNPMAI